MAEDSQLAMFKGELVQVTDTEDGCELEEALPEWGVGESLHAGEVDEFRVYDNEGVPLTVKVVVGTPSFDVMEDILVDIQDAGFTITKVDFQSGYILCEA